MGTTESAMKLFMWSHLLAGDETNNDPVHAVHALRLLVMLSQLPAVAEEMAVEGVLNQILTARVTQVLQKIPGGVSHLDQRPHCPILYTIWADGILPLSLYLLNSVGAPVAAEISIFLNAFPNQLARASIAFRPREGDFITYTQAKEAVTLSMLSFSLDDYRTAGASAAVDPSTIMPLAGFDEHKRAMIADLREHIDLNKDALRGKIIPTNEQELAWQNEARKVEKQVSTVLVEKVLVQMQSAVDCLQSSANEAEGAGAEQEQKG